MKTLTITKTRNQIYTIAEDIAQNDTQYIITEHGEPKMVIMSVDEFESWKETLDIMTQYPELLQETEDARQEYLAGKTVNLENLEQIINENVPSRNKHKSTKKSKKATKRLSKKNTH